MQVIQVAILVLTPPAAGYLTDRLLYRGGRRVAVVNLGISLAAMLFMATALSIAAGAGNWLLVLIILWLIAMNLFHSPALSMLELYVPVDRLPGVAAVFALLSGLAAALEPGLSDFIEGLGAPLTFAMGGVAVAAAGVWFLVTARDFEIPNRAEEPLPATAAPYTLVMPLGVGLVLGACEAVISDGLVPWIAQHGDLFAGIVPAWQSSLLFALSALVAWPLGRIGNRCGAGKLALAGAAGALALGLVAWQFPLPLAGYAFTAFPVAYAALGVSALPLVFEWLTPRHKVLGVGLLFSGIELVTGAADIAVAR